MTAHNITNLPIAQQQIDPAEIMSEVLLAGDLSKMSHEERTRYLMATCQSLGLNPLTKPFDYIRLSGREVLYATKGCADQLRSNRKISLAVTDRKVTGDLMIVTVRASTMDGRFDEDMAAVSIAGLHGEALANAAMKAITKAKRRVTLSICGLGMLDESEVRSVVESEVLIDQQRRTIEATAHPAKPPPPPPPPPPTAKPPLEVAIGEGWEPARFPRGKKGLREALRFIVDAVVDGKPEIVGLNNQLLDDVAEHIPELAEEVSAIRAAAAEAIAAKDPPPDPNATNETDDDPDDDPDDTFPGDMPGKTDA